MMGRPFAAAKNLRKRLKLLVWGESGSGKTTFALKFPGPAVLDLESGTDLYGGKTDFDVLRTTAPDEVERAVEWLGTGEHGYETVVVDPITVYWEALQRKWSDILLRRNKQSKGHKHEFYEFQPKDWQAIKADNKALVRALIALDMNVVLTARSKPRYAESGFMRRAGETYDAEKSLPYLVDVVLRLYRDGSQFLAEAEKDRTGFLPTKPFEPSYALFHQLLSEQQPEHEVTPGALASEEQKGRLRELFTQLDLDKQLVKSRLANYGAIGLDDLSQSAANTIIAKLEAANSAQNPNEEENTHVATD